MTFLNQKLIGWQKDGKWFLSRFADAQTPPKSPRPAMQYDTQQLAIQAASKRGLEIEWSPQ